VNKLVQSGFYGGRTV